MPIPKGREEEFCQAWDSASHQEKLKLAEKYGVSYDTARHWRSDAKIPTQELEPNMQMTIEDILGHRPAINLDFVSFDLETSNLNADFSVILSAAIKPFGQDTIVFRADSYPAWQQGRRRNDKDIVQDITDELRKHAVVITHYGSDGRFDLPFLYAKMVKHGIPALPTMFGIDSWKIARAKFKISSRRLANLGHFFDIGEKSGVDPNLWMEAVYDGSTEALDKIVAHNIVDVEVLEKLACLSFPYIKSIPRL